MGSSEYCVRVGCDPRVCMRASAGASIKKCRPTDGAGACGGWQDRAVDAVQAVEVLSDGALHLRYTGAGSQREARARRTREEAADDPADDPSNILNREASADDPRLIPDSDTVSKPLC